MKRFSGILSAIIIAAMLFAMLPMGVFATETPAAGKIQLKALGAEGSNGKNYLSSPGYSDSVNSYSFNVPDWMPSLKVKITGPAALSCKSDAVSFSESSGVYTGTFALSAKSQSFTVTFSNAAGASRTLTILVNRSKIDCFFDKVILRNGGNEVSAKSGSSASSGYTFDLPAGTKNCEFRLTPRHEEKFFFENTTVRADGTRVEDAASAKKQINLEYYRYTIKPNLIDGANTFVATITGGTVTKTLNITVNVGSATTTETTATTAATVPTQEVPTQPGVQPAAPTSATPAVKEYGCSIAGAKMNLTDVSTGATKEYNRTDMSAGDNTIIGTWAAADNSGTMVFYADNSCLVNGASGTYTLNGTALRIQQAVPTTAATAPATASTTVAKSGGLFDGMSPIMWVFIGVIITVVIGACIFMIVNMGSKKDDGGYYEEEPYYQEPRRPRRNLADYADDDYDDYDDYSYNDRGRRPSGRPSSRGRNFDDYDDDGYGRY